MALEKNHEELIRMAEFALNESRMTSTGSARYTHAVGDLLAYSTAALHVMIARSRVLTAIQEPKPPSWQEQDKRVRELISIGRDLLKGFVRTNQSLPAPYVKPSQCQECGGYGWYIDQERGAVERCDTCRVFDSDDDAIVEALPFLNRGQAMVEQFDFLAVLAVLETWDGACMDNETDRRNVAAALVARFIR